MTLTPRNLTCLAALAAAWLTALATAGGWLLRYQGESSLPAEAPTDWPAESRIQPTPSESDRFVLLLFAHPRCPCTQTTLDEISWLAARSLGRLDVQSVFVRPTGAEEDWERDSLWDRAAALGFRVSSDPGGREARLFGATTSGQVMLYGPGGRLLFSGGVTAGRGHGGDNPGRRAILACLLGQVAECREIPVFGCPLF